MEVKNDMEHLVRAEVSRRREGASKKKREREICWCSLCENDIVAHALNRLPPRYCRQHNYGLAATEGLDIQVRDVVSRALDKVSRRPRHRPGIPDRIFEDVRMENFALKIGRLLVDTTLERSDSPCSCPQCQADALAYALNRYPPKYGVSCGGRESYQENFSDFIRHELGQLITQAARVVATNPHH